MSDTYKIYMAFFVFILMAVIAVWKFIQGDVIFGFIAVGFSVFNLAYGAYKLLDGDK